MANSVDPEQTAPIGAVCSGSTLFASILNLSVMLGNYLQQTTSADNIFRCIYFSFALRIQVTVDQLTLESLHTGLFCMLCCCLLNFFSKNSFRITIRVFKVWIQTNDPDLGPNCLQK